MFVLQYDICIYVCINIIQIQVPHEVKYQRAIVKRTLIPHNVLLTRCNDSKWTDA